ncbi:MAG: hypothetical protein R3C19_26380 [Planctomycetaceae bacterium]
MVPDTFGGFPRSSSTYNADGQPVESINALGSRATQVYDFGRGVGTIDARGNRSTSIYNSVSRVVASQNAQAFAGRRSSTRSVRSLPLQDPLGSAGNIYDSAGRTVATENPAERSQHGGLQHRFADDRHDRCQRSSLDEYLRPSLGRNLAEVNPLDYRTTTVFDAVGRRIALIDARSNRHSFTYDATGNQTQQIDPLDRRGNIRLRRSVAAGSENRCSRQPPGYVFDANGQLTVRKYPDASRATFAYDAGGNRTLMANQTGRYSFSYDGVGNTTVAAHPDNKTITYAWDPVGNRAHMDAPDSGRFAYSHDAANQIAWLHNPFNERTTFTNDNAGRRILQKNANGTRASYAYDDGSNLTAAVQPQERRQRDQFVRLPLRRRRQPRRRGRSQRRPRDWTYDDANQLLSEHRSG